MPALAEALAETPAGPASLRTRVLYRSQPQDAEGQPTIAGRLPSRLHVLTCGSVDDGKSTLIGRMLWDADALTTDQRASIERSPRTAAGTPDFSRLVDGLAAERE